MFKPYPKTFLTLALSLASTSAFAQIHDVAINPLTGENFITQMDQNPEAQVLILNDRDENFRELVTLPGAANSATHVEIELTSPTRLTYLVQSQGSWSINALVKDDATWRALPESQALNGVGQASELRSLPEGHLMATVHNGFEEPQIVVVEGSPAGFRQLGSVSSTAYQASFNSMIETMDAPNANEGTRGDEWGMGFTAGAVSGVGIAYRRHLANNWGFQVGGIAFGDAKSTVASSLGGTLMYTFNKSQSARFYALAGLGSFFQSSKSYPMYSCGPDMTPEQCKDQSSQESWNSSLALNFGVGIGIEWYIVKNLGLVLELPITVMFQQRQGGFDLGGIYPIPNASLVYYFL